MGIKIWVRLELDGKLAIVPVPMPCVWKDEDVKKALEDMGYKPTSIGETIEYYNCDPSDTEEKWKPKFLVRHQKIIAEGNINGLKPKTEEIVHR